MLTGIKKVGLDGPLDLGVPLGMVQHIDLG